MKTDRRSFLRTLTVSGTILPAAMLSAPSVFAQEQKSAPLVDSPPVLQCPTNDGITVVWAVGSPAAGRVEFGSDKEKLDSVAHGDKFGLNPYDERFLQVRIDGLRPNTRYFYRTLTESFRFVNAYKFEKGEPVFSDVYSFTTPGPNKETGSFSVMNDTHQNQKTLLMLTDRLAALGSDYTVWNGDLVHSVDGPDLVVEAMLRPANAPFAVERPMLFVPGNHDYRGAWARNLSKGLPTWPLADPRDKEVLRNFVVRTGPLALIGLDTGEDKPDRHPAWNGLARFEPYRIAQRDWLERALDKPEVKSAPFVVAFCHIPLFDARPDANDGDQLEKWADYQGQSAKLWGPLLAKHGVQAVICAHKHRFRYDLPTEDRPWAQIVGGGHGEKEQVTIIHGKANGTNLELGVDELRSGTELGRWTFEPRKRS